MDRAVDVSGLSDAQLRAAIGVAKAYKERWDMVERACKAAQEDRLTAGQPEDIMVNGQRIGRVSLSRGGQHGRYSVSDTVALGEWLQEHGHVDMTLTVPVADPELVTDGWLRVLVETQLHGVLPPGVKYTPPRKTQVSASLDEDAVDELFTSHGAIGFAQHLLGITGTDTPGEPGEEGRTPVQVVDATPTPPTPPPTDPADAFASMGW